MKGCCKYFKVFIPNSDHIIWILQLKSRVITQIIIFLNCYILLWSACVSCSFIFQFLADRTWHGFLLLYGVCFKRLTFYVFGDNGCLSYFCISKNLKPCHSQSHKNIAFFSILILTFNFNKSYSQWLNAFSCCHVFGWFTVFAVKEV